MSEKSEVVVRFIANLSPSYIGELYENLWCALSLADGTLILPLDESGIDDEQIWVRVRWQGDPAREQPVLGSLIASVALERHVRLHGLGHDDDAIAAELSFLVRHFHIKTGCHAYFPQLREPSSALHQAGRTALRFGQGVLVNLISKPFGA